MAIRRILWLPYNDGVLNEYVKAISSVFPLYMNMRPLLLFIIPNANNEED